MAAAAAAPARSRCPICGTGAGRVVFREQGVDLVRCPACAHVRSTFQAPRDYAGYWGDDAGAAQALHEGAHYWNDARLPTYRQFLRRFAAHRGRLLDVGCGVGFFVKTAEQAGWEAHGSEISAAAVKAGREALGLTTLHAGRVEDAGFAPGSFDAITLWDVIEHLPDPVRLLVHLRDLLRPGGLLFVQTPNASFHVLRARLLAGMRRDGGDRNRLEVRDHLNDFSARSLRLAVLHAGYADPRFYVLLPTLSLGGGRGRLGVAAKLGWYGLAWTSFAATGGRVRVSNTLHLAALA